MPTNDVPSAGAPPTVFYDANHYDASRSVGHLLHEVMFAMRRDIEQRMAEHDLTAAQWLPLWKLKLGAANTAQELARQMNIDAGALTRLLDRLEGKGLIERSRSSTDRRVVHLSLTPAGAAVVRHVPAALAEINNHYLRGFSIDEWEQLQDLLRRMIANAGQAPSETTP